MISDPTPELLQALASVPTSQFLITTAFGDVRDGRIVERVQPCGTQPAMLLIAMEKGHTLSPLIRDSRTFAISLLDPNERMLQRVFGPDRRIGDDPFLTYPHQRGVLGAPIAVTPSSAQSAALSAALRDMTVRVIDGNGKELDSGKGSAILDHPLNAVIWLADDLKKSGITLKPGDLLSLGSFSRPLPPQAGQTVRVVYEGLPGNPSVSVRFR